MDQFLVTLKLNKRQEKGTKIIYIYSTFWPSSAHCFSIRTQCICLSFFLFFFLDPFMHFMTGMRTINTYQIKRAFLSQYCNILLKSDSLCTIHNVDTDTLASVTCCLCSCCTCRLIHTLPVKSLDTPPCMYVCTVCAYI